MPIRLNINIHHENGIASRVSFFFEKNGTRSSPGFAQAARSFFPRTRSPFFCAQNAFRARSGACDGRDGHRHGVRRSAASVPRKHVLAAVCPGQGIFPSPRTTFSHAGAAIARPSGVGIVPGVTPYEGNEKASAGGYPADAGQSFVRIGLGLDQAITVQEVSTPRPSSRHILMLPAE